MTFSMKTFSEITEEILQQVTRGIVRERHEYESERTKYKLNGDTVHDIIRVEGVVGQSSHVFRSGTDYRRSGTMLEWVDGGQKPDPDSSFFVSYTLGSVSAITDVNPGSVVRTFVEAIGLEVDFLYAQMNEVYRAGFIDTASGESLDLVVSLLGIGRKPAGMAQGEVTFGRHSEPGTMEVTRETHMYDGSGQVILNKKEISHIDTVEGTSGGKEVALEVGKDYTIDRNSLIFLKDGRNPDIQTPVYVDYTAFESYVIPRDTRISTYSRKASQVKVFRTLRDTELVRSPAGRWEVTVPVIAAEAGKAGNVYAGTLTVMPSPPIGIEFVINRSDILNGTDAEEDADLRERAKHALETAGKATLSSIRSAVEGIEGVIGDVKVVDQPDGVPGLVQVIASGGNEARIREVIDDTRSAGVLVEFKRPRMVPVHVALTITVTQGISPDEVRLSVDKAIRGYMGSLEIDEDIIVSRIISLVLQVKGVRDVFNVTLNDRNENIEVRFDEKGELRLLDIFMED